MVFDNNTFVNGNMLEGEAIIHTSQRINITFTNNNFTDVYWPSP